MSGSKRLRNSLTDGNANGTAKRANADHQTASNRDELAGNGQLTSGDESDQGHAESPAHQNSITPDRVIGALGSCGHGDKESDEDEEGQNSDPANLLRDTAV